MDARPFVSLDPQDWSETRAVAHRMVDDAIAHLSGLRDRPVWQPMPDDLRATVLRYPMGNIHPRFFAWYMGGSNFTGALGDFLAAVEGSNLGGGDTAAAALDGQVVDWLRDLMGFPDGAGGTLTSGGSMANMVALTVARNAMAGVDVRAEGVTNLPKPLRFYASDQVHSAHQKAMETLGLGQRALALVPTDAAFRMDVAALAAMIAADRAAGWQPACVIATAGTTSTGSIGAFSSVEPGHVDADGRALRPAIWGEPGGVSPTVRIASWALHWGATLADDWAAGLTFLRDGPTTSFRSF